MEPLTHFLTGACIGRAGFNRKTAYATLAAVLAAEAADLDILWSFAGPVEELKHHRGITHTFLGAPFIAAAAVGAVWLFDRWRTMRIRGKPKPPSRAQASGLNTDSLAMPLHWGWLYFAALVAALSHILLDWTNNYGVRPFFPFNARWYAGSIVFIAEPVLWGLFFLALVMPWLFGLTDREIGVHRKPFRGQGWAIFALTGMALVWCWRWTEREKGLTMIAHTQVASEPVLRVALEPYPINPYHWHAVLETKDFYQTAEIDTANPGSPGAIASDPGTDILYKPADDSAVQAAKRTLLGRVYLDWGTWAVVRDLGEEPVLAMDPPALPRSRRWTTVQFTDLRFDYSFLAERRTPDRAPLSGWVYIVDGRDEASEAMGNREQRLPGQGSFE